MLRKIPKQCANITSHIWVTKNTEWIHKKKGKQNFRLRMLFVSCLVSYYNSERVIIIIIIIIIWYDSFWLCVCVFMHRSILLCVPLTHVLAIASFWVKYFREKHYHCCSCYCLHAVKEKKQRKSAKLSMFCAAKMFCELMHICGPCMQCIL